MITRKGFCGIIMAGLVLMLIANVVIAQDTVTYDPLPTVTVQPTNTPPGPPHIRPTAVVTLGPPREYPATLDVWCWHLADRTVCIARLVTNDEFVVLSLFTKVGRSYADRIINYYPLTVEIIWMDVACGEWLGKFEIKVMDDWFDAPDRSKEVIKYCNFIPTMSK